MRVSLSLLAAAFLACLIGAASIASAQSPGTPSVEQEKACNQAAAEHQLKDETRRAFLSDCYRGKATARPRTGPETCSARAKEADRRNLHGEARKVFTSGCLKGP